LTGVAGPGSFGCTDPTSCGTWTPALVWTAQHGWVYLHVIVDCCTREVTGWRVDLRTRTQEAVGCVEHAITARAVLAGVLTLGTDIHSEWCPVRAALVQLAA